jgi:integrase
VQLDLPLWPPTCLRSVVGDYLARHSEFLTAGTLDDYRQRARWVLDELGELTTAEAITFSRLEALADRTRGVLRNVTVRKRIDFLRWCLAYAHDRGLAPPPPRCPKLRNDGQVRTGHHTVDQWQTFRQHVARGRFRKLYDLAFWTGQHMPDLMSMTRGMLAPERQEVNGKGELLHRGYFWRRNQKYRRCVPGWMPLQSEALLLVTELLEDVGPGDDALLVGKVWNTKRTWDMAADRVAATSDVPRVTPTDLRRSCASMLTARGWELQAVRIFLGHATDDGRVMGGKSERRPSIAERHYIVATPELFRPRPQSP